MLYAPDLFDQTYTIDLIDQEADWIRKSTDLALFASVAVSIDPIKGLQESLVVSAEKVSGVLDELRDAIDELRARNADENNIQNAQHMAQRIETELLQQRILRLATVHLKDLKAASRWYLLTSIPQLDGKTARDLVDEGRGEEVETFLSTHGFSQEV